MRVTHTADMTSCPPSWCNSPRNILVRCCLILLLIVFGNSSKTAFAVSPDTRGDYLTAQIDKPAPSTVTETDDNEKTEVTVKGQYIYISTPRTVTIRLYSILGQLITHQNIQPGTTRIKAPGRGVYILQTGSLTKRLTINN
ncbi:MAG: T9SS type A sorting domain-containing protein [Muribaculaceae bacterium]|nr:T9SS type A sorting domain-containing protein [Muribaculaceae bacterium]